MIPLSFKSYFFSVIEEAVFKTAAEYYNEKFGQLEKLMNIPQDSDEDTFSKLKDLTVRARNVLKNDNQMEYYLYWIKFELLQDMAELYTADLERSKVENFTVNEKLVETIKQLYKKHFDNGKKRGLNPMNIPTDFRDKYRFLTNVEHYLSLNIPTINSYNFLSGMPSFGMLDHYLKKLEEEYYAKFTGLLTPSDLGDEEEVIVKFSIDGKNFVWVNTHTDVTCDKEAKLMKHCGNSYHAGRGNDEVFSLREIKTVDKQVGYQPILTFIVDDHSLRESKGSANDKPSPKYHKHIVELLKTGQITRIFQKDSYMAKNNFYFADLSDEQQQEVKEALDAKGVEYELDDESMDYTKDIAKSKELIDEANRELEFVSVDMNTDGDSISYMIGGSFTFPFLNEEFWDNYGDRFLVKLKHYIEQNGDETLQLEEYGEDPDKNPFYVRFNIESNIWFDTTDGRGSGSDLITTTNRAISEAQSSENDVRKEIENVLDGILEEILEGDLDATDDIKTLVNVNQIFKGASDEDDIFTSYEHQFRKNDTVVIKLETQLDRMRHSYTISPGNCEKLSNQIKDYIINLIMQHDESELYGEFDLLGEPIKNLSKIKELEVSAEITSENSYMSYPDSIEVSLSMNYSVYNLINSYVRYNNWVKIRTGIGEFIKDHKDIIKLYWKD